MVRTPNPGRSPGKREPTFAGKRLQLMKNVLGTPTPGRREGPLHKVGAKEAGVTPSSAQW